MQTAPYDRRSALVVILSLLALHVALGLVSGPPAGGWWRGCGFPLLCVPPVAAQEGTPEDEATQELLVKGEGLFFTETFNGNGRTCSTCHRAERAFTIDPAFIATLPNDDPLFVAETTPALAGLEDAVLLRDRGLIQVHPDGFAQPPVFRAPPPLFNLAHTGPFGGEGAFDTLAEFTVNAIRQHFPRTLNRQEGVDFRLPTPDELEALDAFLRALVLPYDEDFSLDRLVRTEAQRRGRELFFGDVAKCGECHGVPVLSTASAALGGSNRAFDTGVGTLESNLALQAVEAGRTFSTPALFGVRHTAPFFHNNAFATLREAVEFYNSEAFNTSPAAEEVGTIALNTEEIEDLVAFLGILTCPRDGDVTQDGRVTPRDAQRVLQQFLGRATPPLDLCQQDQGDVDTTGNGLTPADARCILNAFLGLPSCMGPEDTIPTQVSAVSCGDQSGTQCAGEANDEIPLAVQVTNSGGEGSPNVSVGFVLGDTIRLGTVVTDAMGLATLLFSQQTAGVSLVSAEVADLTPPVFNVNITARGDIVITPEPCACAAQEGEEVDIGVRVTNPDGSFLPDEAVVYALRIPGELDMELARGVTDETGVFVFPFTPPGPGSFLVVATVRNVEVLFYVFVNFPPEITSPGDQANREGDVVSLLVEATDPNNDVLTFSATGLPPDLRISSLTSTTGLISGTIANDAADDYTVIVTVADDRGGDNATTFSWSVAPNRGCPIASEPVVLPFGSLVTCDIEAVRDFDFFDFDAEAGDMVRVTITGSQSNVCPVLELFGPDNSRLADASFSGGCNADSERPAQLDITLSEAGTYRLAVSDEGIDAIGAYSLSLLRLFPSDGQRLEFGQEIEESIDVVGEVDTFAFEGCDGDTVRIVMTAIESAVCPILELFAPPDGVLLASASFGTACNNSDESPAQIDATLPSTGSYALVASDNEADAMGAYSLSLIRLSGGDCTPVSLTITPPDMTIAVGTIQPLTATGTFADGTIQDFTSAVTWAVADTAVATVSNAAGRQGLVAGEAEGETTVTATFGGITGEEVLTVSSLEAIAVTPADAAIALGEMQLFTATGILANGARQDLTAIVTWTPSNPVLGEEEGEISVSATFGEISGETTLTITPPLPVTIDVTPSEPTIAVGTSQPFTATGRFADDTERDLTLEVTWGTSAPDVAVINAEGVATGESEGMAAITARLEDISGAALLTISRLELLAVMPANATIAEGEISQFTATGSLANGTTQDFTTIVTWGSSDDTVATVNNTDGNQGLTTGETAGLAIISATFGEVRGETQLTVTSETNLGPEEEPEIICDENSGPMLIAYGSHTSGCAIEAAADLDAFSFVGSAEDNIRIIVAGGSRDIDPRLELRDPDGMVIADGFCNADRFGGTTSACSFSVTLTLPSSGIYHLFIFDNGFNNASNYTLQLERFPPSLIQRNLPYNFTVADTISPVTDTDSLVFAGVAGDLIRIIVAGGSRDIDPRLELRDPDGMVIADGFCNADRFGGTTSACSFSVTPTLPSSGIYHLSIFDNGFNNASNYEVSLQCLFGACFTN